MATLKTLEERVTYLPDTHEIALDTTGLTVDELAEAATAVLDRYGAKVEYVEDDGEFQVFHLASA